MLFNVYLHLKDTAAPRSEAHSSTHSGIEQNSSLTAPHNECAANSGACFNNGPPPVPPRPQVKPKMVILLNHM